MQEEIEGGRWWRVEEEVEGEDDGWDEDMLDQVHRQPGK